MRDTANYASPVGFTGDVIWVTAPDGTNRRMSLSEVLPVLANMISNSGGGGTTYTAGTGIDITNGVISLDLTNANGVSY